MSWSTLKMTLSNAGASTKLPEAGKVGLQHPVDMSTSPHHHTH